MNLHIILFFESKAIMKIAVHPIFHESPKYFDMDCHFVRVKILEGLYSKNIGIIEHHANILT